MTINYFSGSVIIQKGFPVRISFHKSGIAELSFYLPMFRKWFMWSWIKEEKDGSS